MTQGSSSDSRGSVQWTTRSLWRRPDFQGMSADLRRFVAVDAPGGAQWPQDMPALSVIVPSFNQAGFLERTLRSIINQGYPAIEIIVIDGGSTDGTLEVIERHAASIAYWVSEPDEGQACAINKGLQRATGEWLAFQNSDDLYVAGAFRAMADALRDPAIDMIYGDMVWIDAGDDVLEMQVHAGLFPWMFRLQMAINNQAMFWRRSLMDRAGLVDAGLHFCMDYDFAIRLVKDARGLAKIERVLGAQRLHGEAKTARLQHVQAAERGIVTSRYFSGRGARAPLFVAERLYKTAWHVGRGNFWYLLRSKFDGR